ncbi:DUF1093 domain-containing protein [Enterococcus faecium]|uniref:DUF1093 domain-containing protein n=1 Tax=Enterococcus faecium TaxID=1352 RepID=UPI000A183AB0|nr:DUF1093 domain-containing protein [Enterococcus faecium]SMJ15299.1 Uncharacterized protein conserved in bacteria [Enterococcus faecium]SMJ16809.1 Uncharacterized protein conserved in bacteria [Enterococcus faecium]SMJ17836.1 Uncharacterized protein conserved in bacteria [Enterococcus faecium]SMJ18018.1 Uncharacterized protein conserved in bacteria [Enterococcus faecium]SMJ18081.1 Uncharacterized protein conserved in bacteria [Enterococcus faecium]
MKVIKYLIGLAAISGILLFGLKYYTEGSYGEIPGILDQLNPLVEKGEVYVKTQKPEEVNEYGTARYVQKAADANGKERTVEFNRIRQKSPILYRWVMNAVRYEGYRW